MPSTSMIRRRGAAEDLTTDTYPEDMLPVFKLPFDTTIYHAVPKNEADGHLKLPIGASGRDSFAKACKSLGRWEDAEWCQSAAVGKGNGLQGKFAMIPKSELPKEVLDQY